jgi:MFS transporter
MKAFVPHRVGLYLAVVQFFFAITWTVYVIFLPRLAADAGIPKQTVIFILMLDQLIFACMDLAMGVMADRVSRVVGRLGYAILGVTLLSCLAFLLLPLAPRGAPWLFLALIVLWSASSSVLRAPPLMLLGKYAARPAVPWLSALSLFGLGAAGAVSPYLTLALRNADPRLPFALASIALALATLGVVWVERRLAANAAAAAAPPAAAAGPAYPLFWFLFGVALLGLGFQVHFAMNSAPLYLRFAKPADLEYLMPVFWIGFSLLMLPATLATQRFGGLAVMGAGGVAGALAAYLASGAGSLNFLIAMQFIAGGAWGCVLMSAVTSALVFGHGGREGRMTGTLFSLLALAAFARMAVVAAQLNKDAQFAVLLDWMPVVVWALAGALLLLLVPMQRRAPA